MTNLIFVSPVVLGKLKKMYAHTGRTLFHILGRLLVVLVKIDSQFYFIVVPGSNAFFPF